MDMERWLEGEKLTFPNFDDTPQINEHTAFRNDGILQKRVFEIPDRGITFWQIFLSQLLKNNTS